MEIRTLRYFLEAAREGNLTHAAERLYVSQSTLSRQIKGLEQQLGKKLFVRRDHDIRLTEAGLLLRRHAEDILDMVDKAEGELRVMDELAAGDIRIGCAESEGVLDLLEVVERFRIRHPRVRIHLYSSGTDAVTERLDRGLLDLALIVQGADLAKHNCLPMPHRDRWGVLMRPDDALAARGSITREDLRGLPLICSRQGMDDEMRSWFGEDLDRMDVIATYDLLFNATLMVRAGMGYAIGFESVVSTGPGSGLCFCPLAPELTSPMNLVWRKYQALSPAAERLLEELREAFGSLA